MTTDAAVDYDGFISYSHSADDLLAPRLQAGLQKFAKPWWKRRAVRIFRDESSLAANPHLWSSITEALDTSGWFILLLSPDAAASEWVGKEIDHWREHNDTTRILPVVTDGDFGWDGADVAGSSVPASLRGVFAEEPRWVDMRQLGGDAHLDLKNPTFSAAVADIASAIRGVPKDELASEEVRQHRRTIRTAWSAGALLVILAAAAVGFARNAIDNAQLAEASRLAEASVGVVDDDPELALMLAVASALKGDLSIQTEAAIRQALTRHRSVFYRGPAEGPDAFWTSSVGISPDGRHAAVSWVGNLLEVWEIDGHSDEPLWTTTLERGLHIEGPSFSSDGEWVVATAYWWDLDETDPAVPLLPPPGVEPGLMAWDAETGELVRHVPLECTGLASQRGIHYYDVDLPIVVPPDTPIENDWPANRACDTGSTSDETETIAVVDLRAGEVIASVTVPAHAKGISLAPDPTLLMVDFPGEGVKLIDFNGEIVGDAPHGIIDLSLDGTTYLAFQPPRELSIVDVATEEVLVPLSSFGLPPFSFLTPDARGVVTADADSAIVVANGQVIHLRGHDGLVLPFQLKMSMDQTRVSTASADKTARIWDLEPIVGEGGGYELPPGYKPYASIDVHGDRLAAILYPPGRGAQMFDFFNANAQFWLPGTALIVDSETGANPVVIEGVGGKVVRFSPDGMQLAAQAGQDGLFGSVWTYDAESGERLVEMEGMCRWAPHLATYGCTEGSGAAAGAIDLDYDSTGTMLAMAGGASQRLFVWDPATGATLFESEQIGNTYPLSAVQFSPGGDVVVVSSKQGSWVFDTATWSEIAFLPHTGAPSWALRFTPDGTQLVQAQAHTGDVAIWDTDTWTTSGPFEVGTGQIRDLELTADGRRVVTAHNDGVIAIHDLATGGLLNLLPVDGDVTNIELVEDDTQLIVTTATGSVDILAIDSQVLLAAAQARLSRSFTAAECLAHDLDPCPTLDDLRGET